MVNQFWKAVSLGAGLLLLSAGLLNVGCSSSGKTRFRFMNAVPDQASLNVLVNPTANATPVFSNVGYGTASSYTAGPSGSQTIQIQQAGTSTVIPIVSPANGSITLGSGNDTTLIAANFTINLTVFAFTDNNSTPATNDFNLRVINVDTNPGTSGPGVVVYIGTPPLDISGTSPTVTVGFGGASNYLPMAGGSWELVVATAANPTFPIVDTGPLTFNAGQVRTFVITNFQGGGGNTYSLLSDLN